MQGAHIAVRAGGKKEGPLRCSASTGGLEHPLLPVQEDLVVLQHFVVADVLQPARSETDQQSWRGGFELEGKTGEQPAFAPIDQVFPKAPPPQRPAEPEAAPEPETKSETPAHPLEIALRPGDKANLLVEPAFGNEDDLEEINGVGPMLGELLNEIGVYYFWQVAEWGPAEIEWVDNKLEHFKGRIERDEWVKQAKELAKLPTSAKHPAG